MRFEERERLAPLSFDCHDSFCSDLQGKATFTRTSWRNDFKHSQRVSGRLYLCKADSVRKRHLWLNTENAGVTIHNKIWTDGQHAPRVWFRWESCLQGGRHWKVPVSRPGSRQTLDALRDPLRRPPEPRDPIPVPFLHLEPEVPFQFDENKFTANVRSARYGAAPGPSGLTAGHTRLVLDNGKNAHLL